jgi:hypothetical protein
MARTLRITGGLVALIVLLALVVQLWAMYAANPRPHRRVDGRYDRARWNDDASLEGAISGTDSD